MRPLNVLPEPWLLVPVLASLVSFAVPASAQHGVKTAVVARAAASSTDDAADSSTTDDATDSSTTEAPTSTTSDDSDSTTTSKELSITNTGSAESTGSAVTDAPTITGGAQSTSGDALTGFPTLTGNYGSIPTYPAATVPPTQNAPFMQQSSVPDGTVFIAVGAILGAFGLGILLWRMITTYLLHRSVKKAAMEQSYETSKAGFSAPPASFYKYTDQGSTMSLSGMGAPAGRGVRRTNRGPIPSSNPSQSNLFFSPTAAGGNAAGNRSSAFLPSGFYAAGSSSPGPGHENSISLSNLRPDSRGHYTNASRGTLNVSPPDSPYMSARRNMSTSSLNLNLATPGQRAPSAYLEDLLADDPTAFPPPHMPGSGSQRPSSPHRPGSSHLGSGPNRI